MSNFLPTSVIPSHLGEERNEEGVWDFRSILCFECQGGEKDCMIEKCNGPIDEIYLFVEVESRVQDSCGTYEQLVVASRDDESSLNDFR